MLEEKKDLSLIQKLSSLFFLKRESFLIESKIQQQIESQSKLSMKDSFLKELNEYFDLKGDTDFLLEKFKEISKNFEANFQALLKQFDLQ